jgi:hypothetical protein
MSYADAWVAGRLLSRVQLVNVKRRSPQNSSSRHRQNRAALKTMLESINPAWPLAVPDTD